MAITVGTPIARPDGKRQASFSQSAAAADEVLVADPVSGRVVLHACVLTMAATGTVLLEYNTTTALTGAMDVTAAVVTSLVPPGTKLYCPPSESLTITTVTGAARGYIVYDIEN